MGALAAGIGVGGSIIGGLFGSKGAKKAAKIQRQIAREQIAANERTRAQLTGLEQPTIDRGNRAGDLYAGFLGAGGNPAASQQALATYRGSTGYQDLLNSGLAAVNSNAYASGLGNSGATLKALQAKGAAIADQSAGSWLSGLDRLNSLGQTGIANIAGVSQNITNANNQALQNSADARSNAALIGAAGWTQALQGVGNAASSYLGGRGSSYAAPTAYSSGGALAGSLARAFPYGG